jgi:transcriptional regulator with XRE-family HTH domain
MLAEARAERGWSLTTAAARTGISRRMLGMLEHGQRVPSTVLAEALIEGYRLGLAAADLLRSVAMPNVGRDSPLRGRSRNSRLSPDDGACTLPDGFTTDGQGAPTGRTVTALRDLASPPAAPAQRFVRPGTEDGPRTRGTQRPPWA